MFHLIEFNGEGGQTILVDAFRVAAEMQQHHPDDYETLCRIPIPAHYLDRVRPVCSAALPRPTRPPRPAPVVDARHREWAAPVLQKGKIELRPLQASPIFVRDTSVQPPSAAPLIQVRYNNDDRAPLSGLSAGDVDAFYRAHRTFNRYIRDPRFEYKFQLEAGTVLLFDNHRLLHGRTAFRGHRRLIGCYLNGDDYRSRLRGLLYERDHGSAASTTTAAGVGADAPAQPSF